MTKPLLPIRHPEKDLFICDFGEVIPKSDIASMEHPLFTLSTKKDTAIRNYEHNGNTVTIAPSAYGLATIHDKDILIYCISQLMAGINQGESPSRKVRFKAHDLLVTTNRQTSGEGYKLLRKAFERLSGTRIQTNIKTNKQEIIEGFGIIDSYKIVIDDAKTKRMIELEITLSEWLYNSVIGQEILSIDHDYFRLRKPIERRIYEIARKHCGKQKQSPIGIEKLHKKVGSTGSIKKFREALNHIIKHDHLPEYSIRIESKNVIFNYKKYKETTAIQTEQEKRPFIKPDTIEKAKRILGRSFDVYTLEAEWLQWWEQSGKPELQSSDGAFFNFCKAKIEKTKTG
ncbi:MAG: RepB family plasmid replication initiator protein [Methylomarinum sp.]|nr:RepB family plasmid replication initiator protein [Methylomarinum sp.]